jgi:hypothetical protein
MSEKTEESHMSLNFFFTEKVPAGVICDGRLAEFGIEESKNPNLDLNRHRILTYAGDGYNFMILSVDEDGCVKYLESQGPDNAARIVAALEKTLNTKIEVLDLGGFQDHDEQTKARRVDFWNDQLRGKDEDKKAFYIERNEAGFKIDPETAEVTWWYAQTLDPYGIHPDLPKKFQQVGREYFARAPGSDIWVVFGDLPEATREALWSKHRRRALRPFLDDERPDDSDGSGHPLSSGP